MIKNKIIIHNKQKDVRIPTGIRLLIRRCCHATLKLESFKGSAEVNVILTNDDYIRKLNFEHLNVDSVTDVLSFPMGENGEFDINPETNAYLLGDIVISVERAIDQSVQYGHSFQREIGYLVVHSMLHILGYGHVGGGLEAVRMREREEAVMLSIGLPRGESYVSSGNK